MLGHIATRVGYVGIGGIAGMAFAVYGLGLKPPSALAQLPFAPCKPAAIVSQPSGPSVVDKASGVRVSASQFHFDTGGELPPPAGKKYAVVHIVMHNGGKAAYDYNMLDFALHGMGNSVNYSGDAIDISISNTMFGSGKLAAGQTIAGDIAFEVPAKSQKYTLQWTPGFDQTPLTISLGS